MTEEVTQEDVSLRPVPTRLRKSVFGYNRDTFFYAGVTTADLSLQDWELNPGEEVWLVPAFATEVPPPPCEANEIQKFDPSTGTWQIVAKPKPPAPTEPVNEYHKLSVLDFMDRFTNDEQLALVTAAMQSPAVKLWYDRMLAASFVDLTDSRTIAGMQAITNAGLITEERRAEIMDYPDA